MKEADSKITMDQFVKRICGKVESILTDESLVKDFEEIAIEAKGKLEKFENGRLRGQNFRVTDIVNPMQAYFDIKGPSLDNPPELKYKFAYGKFMENKVKNILSKDPKFIVSQGQVYGDSLGLNDVRGRIDFRLGNTLVEFKTSEEDIPNEETVFRDHPQDLEQLLLYILFTGRIQDEHRLLYLTGRHPNNNIRCFRVKIKDARKIVEYFIQRRDKLKEALRNSNYSGLGKCRYLSSFCKFEKNHMCSCTTESNIDIFAIRNNVFLKSVSGDLDTKISNHIAEKETLLSFWNIFTPRRFFLRNVHPFEFLGDFEEEDLKNFQLRKEIEHALLNKGLIKRNTLNESYPKISEEYFSLAISTKTHTEKSKSKRSPIIIRVQDLNTWGGDYRLPPYYKAQLGLICSLAKHNIGYIFIFFKNSNAGILSKLKFNKLGEIRNTSAKLMKNMLKSIVGDLDPSELPECPEFIRGKSCYKECICEAGESSI